MSKKVCVAGVGMTPFVKPGQSDPYDVMGSRAALDALSDAGIDYELIQQAYVGWVYGDSTSGQRALYRVGMTGLPIINVNNNCSTGSTALYLARQAVASGSAECVLALGFEQMSPGAIGQSFPTHPDPLGEFLALADETFDDAQDAPMALRLFGGAGFEYQNKFGTKTETFAKVRSKASMHAQHNSRAVFRVPLSTEEVLQGPALFLNLTRLQCCPPTCGAAAAILCTPKFAARHGLRFGIEICAQSMTTDYESTFADKSMIKVVGSELSRKAAYAVYETAGIGPEDINIAELHDCFTTNEVLSYEALGFAETGEAEKFIEDGENTYGGSVVTNPSGGLLSKGHPLGATGLAQCAELVWQLRGAAGARQVEGARLALQHNIGLGGACVVTLYERTH